MSESGVRELGVSEARANMTDVIAEVRLLGKPVVLTRREKAQAVIVSVDWYKDAALAKETVGLYREIVDTLYDLMQDPDGARLLAEKDPNLHELLTNDAL